MSNYVIRQRYEAARRRTLVVSEIERLTPHMLRIELKEIWEDFASGAPDDHIKLFFEGRQAQTGNARLYASRL